MPITPDTSELPPTTGQPEGPSVPKSTESTGSKPPEQPISPGAQRIIDSIRKAQGVPREVLGEIAGEKPAPTKIIDMVKGSDGKLRAIVTSEPENPAGIGANPQASAGENPGNAQYQQIDRGADEAWANIQQATSGRPGVRAQPPSGRPPNWEAPPNFSAARPANPRDRWREAELRDQKEKAEKQKEIQNLQEDGSRLAALVYSPEGQQLREGVRRRLVQIVDAAYENSRPKLVTRMPGSARMPADFEMREQAIEMWEQKKQARAEVLLRGEGMTSSEIDAYLTSVLGHESNPMTRNDAENQKRRQLLEQFDRTRGDIGRALLYQSSEAKPVGQRHLLLSRETLDRYGITTSEAQENFAKGWEGVKAQSLQQSQGRHKL